MVTAAALAIGATVTLARRTDAPVAASIEGPAMRPGVAREPVDAAAPPTAEAAASVGTAASVSTAAADPGLRRGPAHDRPRGRAAHRAAAGVAPPGASRAAAGDPRDACADRGFIGRAVCMDRVCRDPAYRSHPQCSAAVQSMEARRRRLDENR